MIIKGLMEPNSRMNINLVNADYVAKQQGLVFTEECKSDREESDESFSKDSLESIHVKIAQVESKFARALPSDSDEIAFEGELKHGCTPFLSKVGSFDVDISLDGRLILVGHLDQPGMIAKVLSVLEEDNVGINFMIVTARKTSSKQALMAIKVEDEPSVAALQRIEGIQGVEGVMFVNL
ncbi:hypothetical protein L7F22_032550 [Adiantum nelumboides]|nr:hypothetical protein [Adiantum nelumboides]